jgi:hypothetical protein
VTAKFVPRVLTAELKENRLFAATGLLHCRETDADFLGNIITGDETRSSGYDHETNAQSSAWNLLHHPRPKKTLQVRSSQFSSTKTVLCTMNSLQSE